MNPLPIAPLTVRDGLTIGPGRPLTLIAGPCVIESEDRCLRIGEAVARVAARLGLPYLFKASFDKANRTSGRSYRGPGLDDGLAVLERVRDRLGVPVTTDVHEAWQCPLVEEVVELVQIPAFLCRQTDLLTAAAKTGRAVSVKKGQFLAPGDMTHVVDKLREAGADSALLIERGSSFGYHNLVVDLRGLAVLRSLGCPVCFDGTHSVQLPGAGGASSGGQREFVPVLCRAAAAVGIDALFLEVHDDPAAALSDGPNMLPLEALQPLLETVLRIRDAVGERPSEGVA